MKLGKGQRDAIVSKVARAGFEGCTEEEVIRRVLASELRIVLVDNVVKLVDHTGRCIPLPGMDVVDANPNFHLTQPKVNYAERMARIKEFYSKDMNFMSASEFEERCQAAIAFVGSNKKIANLNKGPHFPFVMPQLADDLGSLLDNVIIQVLAGSYRKQFPGREFFNFQCGGKLVGQVTVVTNTRHERLIEAMTKGSVCGVYYPAHQGFSITACQEIIGHLPDQLILSGLEVPVVAAMYPEIIGPHHHTPNLDMASLQLQSVDERCSLFCGFFAGGFCFDSGYLNARSDSSGGVSILG